jgi:hypothetical protein
MFTVNFTEPSAVAPGQNHLRERVAVKTFLKAICSQRGSDQK